MEESLNKRIMQKEEIIRCPKCKSSSIEIVASGGAGGLRYASHICLGCSRLFATWSNIYTKERGYCEVTQEVEK